MAASQKIAVPEADENLRKSPGHVVLSVVFTLIFVLQAVLTLGPLIAALLSSFRPGRLLMRYGLNFSVSLQDVSIKNYVELFTGKSQYFLWFGNSLLLTVITVVLTLFICYFVAYGLSMYSFRGKNLLLFLVLATMMVPFEILMLPLYREIIGMKLINTMAGVILPGICSSSTIFFFHQYMIGMPKELLDAGRIDGCTEFGISVRIMMPIAKPAFASMAILCTMGAWNNVLWPMLIFREAKKFTLPIGLNSLLTPYGNNYDLLIAGSMFSILPLFIVFLCFQRYLIEGVTAGAVKG
jgi:arabinosaccharide transport system permease protein